MKKFVLPLVFLTIAPLFAQKNLVLNGNFNNNLDFWRGDSANQSSVINHDGSNCGMIVQYTGANWKGIDQVIDLPKRTFAIELSVWIKADAIEVQPDPYSTGLMTVELQAAGQKSLGYENIATVTGTQDWTLYKKIVKLPEDARSIRIMLALGKTDGTLFFDDVKALALSQEQYNKLMEAQTTKP